MKRYFTLVDGYKEVENLLLCNNYMIIEEFEKNRGYKIKSIEGKKETEFIIDEIEFDKEIPEYIFTKAALRKQDIVT